MTKLQKLLEIIASLQGGFDVTEHIDEDELQEAIDNNEISKYLLSLDKYLELTDRQIVYYSSAIEYLRENDQSLMLSLEIADGYGYQMKDLNSEKLASLLATEDAREEYQIIVNDIEKAFMIRLEIEAEKSAK